VFIHQFVKYLNDGSCSTPPCSLWYNRLWDSIDSYSSSKHPDGETSYCVFSDGEMNEYRQRIFGHGNAAWNSSRLYKAFHFPFKANGTWSWGFTDIWAASFSVRGESLGWEKPPGMENYIWTTVHVRVHGTCIALCTYRSPDFENEFYYAPELGSVVLISNSGGYSSVLSTDKTRRGLWLTGVQKLPPLPPQCQL